jgi:hypothetical protein
MRLPKTLPIVLLFAAIAAASLSARQFAAPPGWKWIADEGVKLGTALDPGEGTWLFGTMAPGWHITTRPAVTLFEPSYSTRGRFAVESETFLFPGTSTSGFGLFVGGQNLDEKGRYTAFLIRRDGSAAVEQVEQGRATLLHAWTKAKAALPGAATGDPVKNVLRIEGEASTIVFLVNGTPVAELSRAAVRPDGVVGLRVGADLNLHVTNLDITHHLALPRAVKR